MALRRFPRRIFQDTLILSVPGGVDRYQTPQGVTTYNVSNVHLQNDNTTHRTAQNTEVTLRGTVWVYPPYSSPDLDYWALQEAAQAAGSVMTCTIRGKSGSVTGPYTVQIIDGLPDDEDNLHHWELGIV